jgi:hypothetical protein
MGFTQRYDFDFQHIDVRVYRRRTFETADNVFVNQRGSGNGSENDGSAIPGYQNLQEKRGFHFQCRTRQRELVPGRFYG